MQSVKFLHIGDIHYPDRGRRPGVDWKDKAMGERLVGQITPNPFKNVADKLRSLLIEDSGIRGVLISGDLTSRGNMLAYGECVEFLRAVLEFRSSALWKNKIIAVVPGNHDIPREEVDHESTDLFLKFSKSKLIWDSVFPGAYAPDVAKVSEVVVSGKKLARVVSLNTCVGCAEKRFLPEEVRDDLHEVLENYDKKETDKLRSFDLLGERLDTPAVLEAHVMDVEKAIQCSDAVGVVIVLGHHALLPQPRVRVELYTELLNGGRFRGALGSLNSNIIYCHGHLHEDPIEVITTPATPRGKIVSIAAPEFQDGFNVIELFFDNSGHPVGCSVLPFRCEPFGSLRTHPEVRMPLLPPAKGRALCDDQCLKILKSLQEGPRRFGELLKTQAGMVIVELQDRLELLDWLGFVEIRNRADRPLYWDVERVGP